jgi:putative ABC transport system permease protein
MTTSGRPVKRSFYERIFPLGIPLAWRQLVMEKKRFAAAVAGITFAVTMMLFQLGLNSALFDQVVAPLLQMRGDLVLISPQFEYFGISREFPEARLYAAFALPEVQEVASLNLGSLPFKNPETGRERSVFIMAFDPANKPFKNPEIVSQQDKLKANDVILFDVLSRSDYGAIGPLLEANSDGVVTEVGGRRMVVGGTFSMGPTFAADGNILMNKNQFLQIWPGAREDQISVGLLTLKPGTDVLAAADKLRAQLQQDVEVYTMAQFIDKEKRYWSERTPIGFVIGASMLVAMIVGAVIVYQILYTDVTDHLPEYATLKSIGFTDGYFIRLVLQESVILSVLGFIPGTLLAALLYWLTRQMAHMPTQLNTANVLSVLGLSVGMCLVAGGLATRKLRQANPADIF